MSHWPFIVGSYAVALVVTVLLVWTSYARMRRAEAEADALRDRP